MDLPPGYVPAFSNGSLQPSAPPESHSLLSGSHSAPTKAISSVKSCQIIVEWGYEWAASYFTIFLQNLYVLPDFLTEVVCFDFVFTCKSLIHFELILR